MKYRYLGNSGLAVSNIGLGTATFGQKEWGCYEKDAIEILDYFTGQGGNFIDTADQYADTHSEIIIGNWLKNRKRDDLVISSKCFFPLSKNINDRGLSRKHIISACEGSLKRLNIDYIDIYQIHNQDPQTPLDETLGALDFLVQQGKVRYVGISNYPAWKITKLAYTALLKNLCNITSGQFLYNLIKRDIEEDILPACIDIGMGVIAWSPLSGGMLTGKYFNEETPPEGSRLELRKDVVKDNYSKWKKKSEIVIEKLIQVAEKNNTTPSVISISWLLKNPNISSVLIGSKSINQIKMNLIASEFVLPDDDWKILSDISSNQTKYPNDIFKNTTQDWFESIF